MTIQEVNNVLMEMGVTAEEMEKYWQENIAYGKNQFILDAHAKGYSWKNLSASSLKRLPTLLEEEKRLMQSVNEINIPRVQKQTQNNRLTEKIKTRQFLTESELKELVNEYSVEDIPGEDNRWTRNMTTIIQVDDEYFSIDWERGLTEMQEDYYPYQPIKVKREERKVTRTVVEWIRVLE